MTKRSALAIGLSELERQAKAASDLFYSLLSRLEEMKAQASMVYEDARIVSEAQIPNAPSAPKRLLILVLALLGGAGLARR